jgi:hypothetical protein
VVRQNLKKYFLMAAYVFFYHENKRGYFNASFKVRQTERSIKKAYTLICTITGVRQVTSAQAP